MLEGRCEERARLRFERILVGFDGSRAARQALRLAVQLATATSGEVTVLIVVASESQGADEQSPAVSAGMAPPHAAPGTVQWSRVCNGVRCTVQVIAGGRPEQVLSDYLAQHGYDVLVVGRRGKQGNRQGGLGLVAAELAAGTTCPLLLVGE